MTGRLVGAIPNLPAAGVVVPSRRVVLPVVPSPEPAAGVSPRWWSCFWGRRWSPTLRVHPAIRHRPPRPPEPGNSSIVTSVQDDLIVTPKPRAGSGWGDSNSTSPISSTRGQRAIGMATCRFDERSVTALVHRCPWFAHRLRTQHGPRGPVPSGRGRLRRSGPPRAGTGSAGRARQGRSSPWSSASLGSTIGPPVVGR
jgi:hypothetical protein